MGKTGNYARKLFQHKALPVQLNITMEVKESKDTIDNKENIFFFHQREIFR